MSSAQNDLPISIQEVELFWSKSKKAVWWAIQRDIIKARQSVASQVWMVSYNSCVEAWGQPLASNIVAPILEDWNGN